MESEEEEREAENEESEGTYRSGCSRSRSGGGEKGSKKELEDEDDGRKNSKEVGIEGESFALTFLGMKEERREELWSMVGESIDMLAD